MVYTPDFSLFESGYGLTRVLAIEWIVPLILTFLAMAFITRDVEKWKILALPMMTLMFIFGLPVSPFLLMLAGLVFVIEIISTQVLGNTIEFLRKRVTKEGRREATVEKMQKRVSQSKTAEKYLKNLLKYGKETEI